MTTAPRFKELPEQLNFAKMEEEVLAFWAEIDAFKTSLKKSEGRKEYTFYDGPPFATGLPHYGHILAGTIKDIVCRYAHQTGHYVERRFGWDCHGLPIEHEIEKDLGIKSSQDVKKMGIAAYNDHCRSIVMRYSKEWETIVTRCGRWIDFENDYKTMNLPFMESVWWVFKTLWDKGLVYRGFKVMPYSTACTTPLSNFECNMNYKDVSDPSVTVSFPLLDEPGTHLLAWTTTPWTLPSNLALVVHPDMDYIKVKDVKTGRFFIFAECRLDEVYKNHAKAATPPFERVETYKGKDMAGKKYVPLFDFFSKLSETGAFRVVCDTYVTSDSGTGVVHTAPGFGEEDFRISMANGIIDKQSIVCPVDENGCFTAEVPPYEGKYIKDCDSAILDVIKKDGRLFQKASVVHSYPFCWRSETPLIYRAIEAWFVNVESICDKLLEQNAKTYWIPDFVKSKRFSNWLEGARDWNVSRNRYWGTPLPVWRSEDWEEVVCVGSVEELCRLSGRTDITDLHRQYVDDITIPSKREGHPPLRRIEQVFDCWFESGSMPYGHKHYPFENADSFEKNFPADFIAEGLDQTRGWFYTLMVLSTALMEKPPFKNLIVNGLVLAEDGKKMSKSKKNYPPATEILDRYGADAVRLFLINSPVVRAEPLRFSEKGVKSMITDVFLPLANAVKFFVMSANLHLSGGGTVSLGAPGSTNDMDRWIRAAAQTLVQYVRAEMAAYRLYTVVPGVLRFLDTLTNWYVRMNRRRLKGNAGAAAAEASLNTLFDVLYTATRVLGPFTPFLAETIYQTLKPLLPAADQAEDSVHYHMIPEVNEQLFDVDLERAMARMITVIDLVRVVRNKCKVTMRMPLKKVVVIHPLAEFIADLQGLVDYVKLELNVVDVAFTTEEGDYVDARAEAQFAVLGRRLKEEAHVINKALKAMAPAQVRDFITAGGGAVAGHDLTAEDVKIVRTPRVGITGYEANTDGSVLVLVDTSRDEAMISSWRTREFVARVQALRKAAGLRVADRPDVLFDAPPALAASLAACSAQLSESLVGLCEPVAAGVERTLIASDECNIDDMDFKLHLAVPTPPRSGVE